MKLEVCSNSSVHKELCTAVGWTSDNECYSFSDDQTIQKWDREGEPAAKVAKIEAYATCMSWVPTIGSQSSESFAMGCSDGGLRLFSKAGREEKKVEAHNPAACTKVAWSYDGTALCTCGEDGKVKVWSRSGNLRSTLLEAGRCVYTCAWSPDNEAVLLGVGKDLLVKGVQAGKKQLQWAAHEGLILAVDWNIVNNLIVSGSEDCTFKVWDAFGRQLYHSSPSSHVITSIKWCPNGEAFAVGSFNLLRLCDKTGWSYCRERPQCGSVMDISWTSDGTQLAGAGGNGTVVFGQLVRRVLEWEQLEAVLVDSHKIQVQDVGADTSEELDFSRERVIEMALGYGHLVAATATQCFIYNADNWNTPHIFDLRGTVGLLVLAESHFLTLDNLQGVQVWSYEGRQVSNPRFQNLRPEFLNSHTISLSRDTVAILSRADCKTVHICDVQTGRAMQEATVTHDCEVLEIHLNQFGATLADRRLVFIDCNRDMWICSCDGNKTTPKHKLYTQVDSCKWNDSSDMLVAIADGRLVTWYYPNAFTVDRDLLSLASTTRDAASFGKMPRIKSFFSNKVTVRKADGALLVWPVPVYPAMLYEFSAAGRWEQAVRLCRFLKSEQVWACLAGMALQGRNLDVAEEAMAALKAVDKLEYIMYIKEIPSEEARNAELALYRRCPEEAERVLLQASPPLVYRAVKMNIKLFRWSRALDVAIQHRSHVDTVLGYRQRFLEQFGGKTETDARFIQYNDQVPVDWEAIEAKEDKEGEDERERAGVGGGGRGTYK